MVDTRPRRLRRETLRWKHHRALADRERRETRLGRQLPHHRRSSTALGSQSASIGLLRPCDARLLRDKTRNGSRTRARSRSFPSLPLCSDVDWRTGGRPICCAKLPRSEDSAAKRAPAVQQISSWTFSGAKNVVVLSGGLVLEFL